MAEAPRFRSRVAGWVVTMGPAGHSAVAPGTCGALFALPVALLFHDLTTTAWVVALAAVTCLAAWQVSVYLGPRRASDPQEIVVDEFVGCLIALACVPATWGWYLCGFVAFRLFDILKPWPVNWIDRHVSGAWGVMGDDVAAGLMAGCMLAPLAG